MRKVALVVGLTVTTLLLSIVFVGLYFFNKTLNIYQDCTRYAKDNADEEILLVGKIYSIEERDDWIISSLALCGNQEGLFTVEVYTPAKGRFFSLGKEQEYKGTESYIFETQRIEELRNLITLDAFYAVRAEGFLSENDIKKQSVEAGIEDCDDSILCKTQVAFYNDHDQNTLAVSIKEKNLIRFFLNMVKGKSKIYGSKFGKVESTERFKYLYERLLI